MQCGVEAGRTDNGVPEARVLNNHQSLRKCSSLMVMWKIFLHTIFYDNKNTIFALILYTDRICFQWKSERNIGFSSKVTPLYTSSFQKLSGRWMFGTSMALMNSGAISLSAKPAMPQPMRTGQIATITDRIVLKFQLEIVVLLKALVLFLVKGEFASLSSRLIIGLLKQFFVILFIFNNL